METPSSYLYNRSYISAATELIQEIPYAPTTPPQILLQLPASITSHHVKETL